MAVIKRYTEQIVVMQTEQMGQQIKALADERGLSVAQVARDAQALGLPLLRKHYDGIGVTKPASTAEVAPRASRERVSTKRGAKTPRGKIPPASFVSPVGAGTGQQQQR